VNKDINITANMSRNVPTGFIETFMIKDESLAPTSPPTSPTATTTTTARTTTTTTTSNKHSIESIWSQIKKPALNQPPKYGEHNADARNVFVSDNELSDGVNIQKARTVSNSSYHDFAVVHGISIGSMMKPPEYNITLNYGSTTGILYSQYTSNNVFIANMKQKFFKGKWGTEALYINANDTFRVKNDFSGEDYVIEAGFDKEKGRIEVSYMQSLLKNLSAGIQASYKTADRKSRIATCACYSNGDQELAAEYGISGSGPATNVQHLKTSYCRKYDDQLSLCTELNYNLTDRDVKFNWGFAQSFLNGKVRVTSNENLTLKLSFDYRINPSSNINVVMSADPSKSDYKFGLNIHIQ
jgi:hypothetical protein